MTLSPALGSPGTPVIITGGASGIGLASAQALAAVGRPVALWDINGAKAADAAAAITAEYGVAAVGVAADLSKLDAIAPALAATRAAVGAPGGLVHAAGIVDTGSLEGITPESWEAGIGIHLRAFAFVAQAIQADLAAQPGSAIVAIASINATLGNGINPIYSAAKGGLLSIVRSLADRLGRDGVRVNSVSPGQIMTPMMKPAVDNLPPRFFENRILLDRIGDPAEIGRVVRFLLSNEASYITASEIVVDGGNISSQRT
ncbi:NAD(P)-dependent dehydrogenase, short-chain alcohol dehydrogenase family [Sphingomonas laterariae]|uniref:NAD(P)-dependent dehydrogenase, short-chain alcohol dehydrogenase family n=1 Tax=Edaphosphingomonas laterariae TaxID=861865 RepID=A0A239ETQ7_9SPHN|nr:SDR family oxidoreductase [Sphingomonas laterariae]SNS47423.1 NAD(P)-dependent dehydrogenase, short-chain alcohol dehydrogenase family [Sphingomonas laterariae]